MNILFESIYGSQLYGMASETSDVDVRGVYLPSKEDCYLDKIRATVDGQGDTQYFSLQRFLRLAAEGQSVALEMLFTPTDKTRKESSTWTLLQQSREMFITKKIASFCSFAKAQSTKYAYRADRLNDVIAVQKLLTNWACTTSAPILGYTPLDAKLSVVWNLLPETINLQKSINTFNRSNDNRVYIICGRQLQVHCTVAHVLQFIKDLINEYGERVRKASTSQIDYKSISHAFRVTYQVQQLIEGKQLTFPSEHVAFLRQVKFGQLDLLRDELDVKLESLIKETDELIAQSDLPDSVDWSWCERFVLQAYQH